MSRMEKGETETFIYSFTQNPELLEKKTELKIKKCVLL